MRFNCLASTLLFILYALRETPFVRGQEAGLCVRKPSVDCRQFDRRGMIETADDLALHQQLLEDCQAMLTCRVFCNPFADPCLVAEDSFCTTTNTESAQCEDLSSEDCATKRDCLWVPAEDGGDDVIVLHGPFDPTCRPGTVVNVPGGIGWATLFVDDICWNHTLLQVEPCGVPSDALGRWIPLRSTASAPLRIEAELYGNATLVSNEDLFLSVFVADDADPGKLTCLKHISLGDDVAVVETKSGASDPAPRKSVVVDLQVDQVVYVLVSVSEKVIDESGRVGNFRLSALPGTAKSACDLRCETFRRDNATCTCEPQRGGKIFSQVHWQCEICRSDTLRDDEESICILESENIVYDFDGTYRTGQYCYQSTEGFNGDTVCVEYNDDETPSHYTVNGMSCTATANPSCDRSSTFDCSDLVQGAIFDWCNPDGYEGVLAVDKWMYMDNLDFSRQCRSPEPALSSTPTMAPSQPPSSALSYSIGQWILATVFVVVLYP
mmetsp:Transcript_3911/g.7830  ORF Transcript_3911/g.7830 Transcript_3911/m.7830 type:complete len:495 (+) Transcript_3911:71-1555(+)